MAAPAMPTAAMPAPMNFAASASIDSSFCVCCLPIGPRRGPKL
jgi:hypothetical protein